jgi:hypothetical protein
VKKEQESTVTPIKRNSAGENANEIPMKKEVQVDGADNQEPAKIIFITSGFGKIHVSQTTNTSPMAIAA